MINISQNIKTVEKLKSRYKLQYYIKFKTLFMPKQNLIIILIWVNLIKNYLRLVLGPENFSHRATLSVENKMNKEVYS